jgi:hypothetical protein
LDDAIRGADPDEINDLFDAMKYPALILLKDKDLLVGGKCVKFD